VHLRNWTDQLMHLGYLNSVFGTKVSHIAVLFMQLTYARVRCEVRHRVRGQAAWRDAVKQKKQRNWTVKTNTTLSARFQNWRK
jgi:hypothetical protein